MCNCLGLEQQIEGPFLEVSDFGEGYAKLDLEPHQSEQAFEELAKEICRGIGVTYQTGSISTSASLDSLGDAIWRVALASAQLTNGWTFRTPPRRERQATAEFANEVATAVEKRKVDVRRDQKFPGASGHIHKTTIFLPDREAIMEPVGSHWNQAVSIYAKFGDLSRVNGYRLYSVVDDRQRLPDEEIERLLIQVSGVVVWSRRETWIEEVIRTP